MEKVLSKSRTLGHICVPFITIAYHKWDGRRLKGESSMEKVLSKARTLGQGLGRSSHRILAGMAGDCHQTRLRE